VNHCQTCGEPGTAYECDDCWLARTGLESLKSTADTALTVAVIAAVFLIAILIGVML